MTTTGRPSKSCTTSATRSKNQPFTAVSYFRAKLLAFIKLILHEKMGVTAHFAKLEFQGRGSIHAHMLLWHPFTEGIFVGREVNQDRFVHWADQFVSAFNPYFGEEERDFGLLEKQPDEIADVRNHGSKLLNVCVRHTKCSKGCLRNSKCRFNFPRPIVPSTRVTFNNGQSAIHYKRNDPLVQSHNKAILG